MTKEELVQEVMLAKAAQGGSVKRTEIENIIELTFLVLKTKLNLRQATVTNTDEIINVFDPQVVDEILNLIINDTDK